MYIIALQLSYYLMHEIIIFSGWLKLTHPRKDENLYLEKGVFL